jgi:hypothetical protein
MNSHRPRSLSRLIPATVTLLAVTLTSTLFAADPFEGRVRMEIRQGTATQKLEYHVKGEKMRVTPEGMPGQGSMILDMEKKEMLMLMPAQKMYMAMPVPDMKAEGEETKDRPQAQKETREILGYKARKYLLRQGQAEYEIWATEELGKLGGLQIPGQRPGATGGAGAALGEEEFFPLIIKERRGGEVTTHIEVVEVEKLRLPDSLFDVPSDFRRMESPVPMPR